MFDDISGWRVGVEQTEWHRLYIVVSPQNVVEASRLLSAHAIPHAVEGAAPIFQRTQPPENEVTAAYSAASAECIE